MPDWRGEVLGRLAKAGLAPADEAAIAEELAQHLEDRYQELRAQGVAPEAARGLVLTELAGEGELATRLRRAVPRRPIRPAPGVASERRWLRAFWGDVRFGGRMLRANPAFTVVAMLVLALGIGANTAIFSAVHAVVLQPLPFTDPGRLYMLWEKSVEKGWDRETAAPANMYDWKAGVPAFADVAAYADFRSDGVVLTGAGAPQVLEVVEVTGNFFSVLGVAPALGRVLRPEETWRGTEPVVVLSHGAWVRRFGGDRSVMGRLIQLNGVSYRVVGVMPAGFAYPREGVEAWRPMRWDPASRTQAFFRRAHWVRPIARLRRGATAKEAATELQAVVKRLQTEYPETNRGMGAGMTPLHRFLVGDTRTPLLVLLASVGLLLLIGCANIANLLLVRATGRAREMAVRRSLGADNGRLVQQLLTESLLLSTLGGGAGLLLGWWGTRLLQRLQPEGLLRVAHFGLDTQVVLYVVAIALASGLLFGLAPALWAGRTDVAGVLREGGRSGAVGRGARRAASGLVIAEVALALLLVVGAGLLARSYWRLERVDPGFTAAGVLAVTLELPGTSYDTADKVAAFYREVLARCRALPGVEAAGAVSYLPLTNGFYTSDFAVAGRDPDDYGTEAAHRRVTPGYFRAMRVPLQAGRLFTDADRKGSAPVVLINDALARQYFPGEDPVGQRITPDKHPDSTSVWSTIIGVVGSERQTSMVAAPQIEILDPFYQDPGDHMSLVLRTGGDPEALVPAIRHLVHDLDQDLPIFQVQTLAAVRDHSLARQRFLMTLLLVFAGVALALAVVGVYGVTAQAARQRTQEIGIRMALGARARDVLRLVVGRGIALVTTGMAVGLLAALLATRAMRAMLFQVAPGDPVTLGAVALLLLLTGAFASWLPARRASRVDPAVALRQE